MWALSSEERIMMKKVQYSETPRQVEGYHGGIMPIMPIRYDFCPHCSTQQIDLFSFNNYPQGYSDAVTSYLKGNSVSFDKYEIRYMKCKSCGKEFMIEWANGCPRPLKDPYRVLGFVSEFEMGI